MPLHKTRPTAGRSVGLVLCKCSMALCVSGALQGFNGAITLKWASRSGFGSSSCRASTTDLAPRWSFLGWSGSCKPSVRGTFHYFLWGWVLLAVILFSRCTLGAVLHVHLCQVRHAMVGE